MFSPIDDGIVVVMPYVYLAHCADDTWYVGKTDDLANREQIHNDGNGAAYTAKRRPIRIVYAEEHATNLSAARRERQLKRWSAPKKKALIAGRLTEFVASQRIRPATTWRDLLSKE